jgi:hypothetical protein
LSYFSDQQHGNTGRRTTFQPRLSTYPLSQNAGQVKIWVFSITTGRKNGGRSIELNGLSESQCRALAIADNQLAINGAGWDEEILRIELAALQEEDFDLSLIGFDRDELARLSAAVDAIDGLTDQDAVPYLPEEPISAPGDLWILGDHQLVVVDALNSGSVSNFV